MSVFFPQNKILPKTDIRNIHWAKGHTFCVTTRKTLSGYSACQTLSWILFLRLHSGSVFLYYYGESMFTSLCVTGKSFKTWKRGGAEEQCLASMPNCRHGAFHLSRKSEFGARNVITCQFDNVPFVRQKKWNKHVSRKTWGPQLWSRQ